MSVLRHIFATYLSEEMLLIKRRESHIKRVIKLKKIAVEVILASLLFLPLSFNTVISLRKGSKRLRPWNLVPRELNFDFPRRFMSDKRFEAQIK